MLLDTLLANKDAIRFHTPAHNGSLPLELLQLDVTELPYSDNLLNAKGVLKGLEEELACAYNVKRALISTNGATNCILTALKAVEDNGNIFILGRAHISVFNAAFLTKNKVFSGDTFPSEDTLISNGIKTVVATSPDYFGNILPLKKIKAVCEKISACLIVDSSHGSHFILSDVFPVSASEYADLAIYSLHKTLPVATGGAMLAVQNERFIKKAEEARKVFHSTSPSYITLASIDLALSSLDRLREGYAKAVEKLKTIKESPRGKFAFLHSDDAARLVISSPYYGEDVYNLLAEKKIYLEAACENKLIAIVTPFNYQNLDTLITELENMQLSRKWTGEKLQKNKPFGEISAGGNFRIIPLKDAEGAKAYAPFGIYPPGTAVCGIGETITKAHIELMEKHINRSFGVESGCVYVVL